MTDKPSVIRETDDEARKLARMLLRSARHAALAVLEPETGFPFASRVLCGIDIDGAPVILVSGLSTHTKALDTDPRASLLTGEPGSGDPLAYPRLTVQCLAGRVTRDDALHARLRRRFLNRHPKAKLYIDFPDFCFFRLVPQSASLNGGFGRAFLLDGEELIFRSPGALELAARESDMIRDIEERLPEAASEIALRHFSAPSGKWRVCGIDMAGLDLTNGDIFHRFEFEISPTTIGELISIIAKTANPIP